MIYICWNCRGTGAASTVKELKEITLKYKPHLVFLSETKPKSSKLLNLKRRLSFDEMYVVDCNGRSGDLCLFWKKSVNVEILYSDCNVIHSYIISMNTKVGFHYFFVYGNPISQQRQAFWAMLKNLPQNNSKPWICAGDFNEVLYPSNKNGGHEHNRKQMQNFANFLSNKNMEELPQKGCKFTWCNNRQRGTVQEKLDRCIVNWEWRKLFPHAIVTALVPISSDHSPLIIDDSPSTHCNSRTFKLEHYWTEHEDFRTVVDQSWKMRVIS